MQEKRKVTTRSPKTITGNRAIKRGRSILQNVCIIRVILGPIQYAPALYILLCAVSAFADVRLKHSGSVESDLRLVVDNDRGTVENEPYHFNWNRNQFEYQLTALLDDRVRGVGHLKLVYFGISEIEYLGDQIDRERHDPFRVDSDALFIEIRNFVLDDLDIKLGRQIVNWGTADQFNPTNNLNPYNYEDPLLFGQKLGNQMAVAQYNFPWLDWSLQGVWIPLFRPSLLPASAMLGVSSIEDTPIRDKQIKEALVEEYYREKNQGGSVFIDPAVRINFPEPTLDNMSGGARTKLTLGDFDLSASYYNGRFGYPVPKRIVAYAGDDVITDGGTKTEQHSLVDAIYPRMQVAGFDMAATLPWLFDLGVWFEGAAIHPERVELMLYTTNYVDGDPCAKPGDKGTDIHLVCSLNTEKWFFKATAGFDYTFASWLYANFQYIHGFVDEFGYEEALNDYIVGGVDMKFFSEAFLIRLFSIYALQDSSSVVFPQVAYKFRGAELQLGGLVFLGDYDTKFGAKANGRDWIFTKAKLSF
ncbi:MAG: hypothetical protein Kow0090_06460 [Myxococcota bacterium]